MTSPFRHEFELALTLESPFVTKALALHRPMLDTALARAGDRYMLPGTLVQGVLSAALATLRQHMTGPDAPTADELRRLFGAGSGKDNLKAEEKSREGWRVANEPERGLLDVGDLLIDRADQDRADKSGEVTRVALDAETGAAREGFLQVIELPFPIGEKATFRGTVHLRQGSITPARAKSLIECALALVPAIGAVKSAGFGRVCERLVGAPATISSAGTKTCSPRVAVEFTLDRPFVIDADRIGGNLFRGRDVIPGAVLKGALATALGDAGRLDPAMGDTLAAITVSHAFPLPAGGATPRRAAPLSLAVAEKRVFDRLLADDNEIACVRKDGRNVPATLAFEPDFKDANGDQSRIAEFLGQRWQEPDAEVRTRTAIEHQLGAAEEDKLFSYKAIVPKGFRWRSTVTAPAGVDMSRFGEALAFLEAGLGWIGKTGAVMRDVTIQDKLPPTPQPVQPGDVRYALVLQTPALLNDLRELRQGRSAFEDYQAYFAALGYALHRHFARQRVVGGYHALRYPPRQDRYEVYVLTEPGSVFLIEPKDPKKGCDLPSLLTFGLPPKVPDALRHWRHCPFLPENGFGEVRCHVVDKDAVKPTGKEVPLS